MAETADSRKSNTVILENRKSLSVSGVSNVDNFDTDRITVYTDFGTITVNGNGLHVDSLSTQSGELFVEGKIDSVIYSEEKVDADKGGFFSRLFR